MTTCPTSKLPTLRGIALALAVVLSIGVLTACDMISGRVTPGQYVDDTTISAKVKIDLANDPLIASKPFQINVETMQSVVLLSGFVDTVEMKQRALAIARKVDGVKAVRDAMQTPTAYKK
jgi:osmotically-inducible protein OsmY